MPINVPQGYCAHVTETATAASVSRAAAASVADATEAVVASREASGTVEFHGEQLVLRLGLGAAADLDAPLMTARTRPGPGEVARLVATFHRAFDLPRRTLPSLDGVDRQLLALRTALLDEEAAEFADAAARRDLVGLADALADVVYVSYGTAVTLGIDLDAVLREVHRSNMSKLDGRGRPVLRDDGKVLKSPRYTRPDVASVLQEQLPLPL